MKRIPWLAVAIAVLAIGSNAYAQCPAPSIVSPTGGATNVPTFVTLNWTAVAGATRYDVFIAKATAGGCTTLAGTSTSTSFNPPQLEAGAVYEWKVRAFTANCPNGVDSSCARFTTAAATCPTTAPTLVSPAANAQLNPGAVTFSWNGVSGAIGYELWLSLNGGTPSRVGGSTGTSETKTLPAGNYTWYVVALFGNNCASTESGRSSFTVLSCPPAVVPTLRSPANGATFTEGTPVTLDWSNTGASQYEVLLSGDGGQTVNVVATTTSTTTTLNTLAAKTYSWAVRAVYPAPCAGGAVSPSQTFKIEPRATCVNGSPVPKSPAADASLPPGVIAFEWDPVPNATGYRLMLVMTGPIPTVITQTPYTGPDTKTNVDIPPGYTVSWFVQATFANCPATESARRLFTTRQATSNCPAGPITLTSPANGSTTTNPAVKFTWNAVANATKYAVLGSVNDGAYSVFGTSTSNSLEATVPVGKIKWLVVGTADNCADVRSSVFEFEVTRPSCPDASIALRAPANNSTTSSPVTFQWTEVANATSYRVWVSINGSTAEIVERTTSPQATVRLAAGTAIWSVEALRNNCPSVLSPKGQFTISPAASCSGNAAPTLVSPIGTLAAPVELTSPVTLKWNAAANAIAYRVWVALEGQPYSDIALTKNTELTREVTEDGHYSWFVEAIFEGCPSQRSAVGYFEIEKRERCGTAAPAIIAPANGATVSSPVTFSWGAVPDTEEYRVIASLNGGQKFVLGTTTDTTLTRVLPPGEITWIVEAVFEECPSTFSAAVAFRIPEAQNCPTTPPQLVSPANGATNVSAPVELMWNAIPNAIRYVVMIRFNDGSPTPAGETANTSLTLRTLPGGRFEWWVLAFVTNCRPVESAHFNFSITSPENCDNRRPIVFEPASGSVLLASQVEFEWSRVPNAKSYKVWAALGDAAPAVIATTTGDEVIVDVSVGVIKWYVEAVFESCPSTHSAPSFFVATAQAPPCRTPGTPRVNVVGQALSGTEYSVRWTPLPNVDLFELQESTTADFSNATTTSIDGLSAPFTHNVDTPTRYLYRVRAISNCSDERGAFSNVVGVIVAPLRTTGGQRNASAEVGNLGQVVQRHFVPGAGAGATFSATVDKPWLKVQPASGNLPLEGITLDVIGDPSKLNFGTNTATVTVVVSTPSMEGMSSHGTSSTPLPFSISLVTPVTPSGKSAPPPDSLIIPAVAHAVGANDSQFESDIRLTNLGATTAKYQVNFTPSGVDGTTTGTSSTIEVAPNETTALDDILATMFGTGTTSIVGMLEIRPLSSTTSSTSFVTSSSGTLPVTAVASSRTYNFTPTGTFGQFIPAIPYSQFVGKGTILSLQQVAQSSAYRSNFGFAEASGQPADLTVRVYDTKNALLATIPLSLKASEHRQLNSMLTTYGITDLKDGRVEVEVTSATGKVTAYASGVDNATNDPLLVSPSVVSSVRETRYVVPGVALLNNGIANWRTDMRVFNGAATPQAATVTFYPQGNPGAPVEKTLNLQAGEIAVLDNVLETFFQQANPNPGGSVIVSTSANSQLVATARTYNQTPTGTYGQFVPGVSPSQAAGRGERSLNILQLEYSTRIRTNIGLAETTGKPVRVEVSLVLPDSKVTPVIAYDLAANEFRQISLADFGLGNSLYNVRATVKVIDGDGRVTAYGSAIDMQTQDPTYVPAM